MSTVADLPPRIAAKITVNDAGCWLWTASASSGYGMVRFDGRNRCAHRVVYELLVAPIPHGLELDHLCRTKLCVNPAHLDPVTHRENLMRGNSPTAVNARRTHCASGHPLTGDNLFVRRSGGRDCRTCRAQRAERFRLRRLGLA